MTGNIAGSKPADHWSFYLSLNTILKYLFWVFPLWIY